MQNEMLLGNNIIKKQLKKKHRVDNINAAKEKKDDEFYTLYENIAKEIKHYEAHFRGKVVYCNCDDPARSNFPKFFMDNYERLGLAGLETNHLRPDGTGDFRSREAMAKLERADIVVTNPPFSLFRQFIAQLIEPQSDKIPMLADVEPKRDKKFLVIGGMNNVIMDSVFKLIKENKMWTGTLKKADDYLRPDGTIKPINTAWFTNIDYAERHKDMILPTRFADMKRVKFDNYDMINIDRMKDIPCDYDGVMGISIRFLLFHNPTQFDVLGKVRNAKIDGEIKYTRIVIKKRQNR